MLTFDILALMCVFLKSYEMSTTVTLVFCLVLFYRVNPGALEHAKYALYREPPLPPGVLIALLID